MLFSLAPFPSSAAGRPAGVCNNRGGSSLRLGLPPPPSPLTPTSSLDYLEGSNGRALLELKQLQWELGQLRLTAKNQQLPTAAEAGATAARKEIGDA